MGKREKLTDSEKETVLKAAEFIDTGRYEYSCAALGYANLRLHGNNLGLKPSPYLVARFKNFYLEQHHGQAMWPGLPYKGDYCVEFKNEQYINNESQHLRVMLLLLFLEANS